MRGTITRRRDGWKIQVYAGRDPISGRRRFLTRQINGSRAQAETALAELVADVANRPRGGAPVKDLTVGELHAAWLEVAGLEPSSAYQARSRWRCYGEARVEPSRPPLAQRKVRRVTGLDLDRLYAALLAHGGAGGTPLDPATVRRFHADLSALFGRAVKWGWITVNPASHASPPPVPTRRPKAPTARQVRYLLAVAADAAPQLATFVRVAAATGARRGEVCHLRWGDITFGDDSDGWGDDGWGDGSLVDIPSGCALVVIDSAVGVAGHATYAKTTKTGDARVLVVDPGTAEELRAHRRRCAEQALAAGTGLGDDDFVFRWWRHTTGRPWHPSSATHEFEKVRALAVERIAVDPAVPDRHRERFAAAVAAVQMRQLRHFVATQLGAHGVQLADVSAQLGHARSSTTADFYQAAFAGRAERGAHDVLGAVLDG